MADPTGYAAPIQIQTGFKDWAKYPVHMFGLRQKRPIAPMTADEIYAQTQKVLIRDDLFEGSVRVPISLKTHNPGQVISRFTTNSNYSQAIAHGVFFNMVMNPVMSGLSGTTFINGVIRYSTWRLRGKETGGGWHVIVGTGVHADGVSLTQMYVLPGPIHVLSADFTVGQTNGDVRWQLEVGFGSTADAIATTEVEGATAAWPAYG